MTGGIPNSDEKYSWAVDSSLGAEATYGLVVKLESNPDIFQYSNPFKVKAGNGDGGDGGDDGKPIYTVTTATGIKTVTLTSCPPSTTSTISTTSAISTTSTPIQTTTSTPNTTSVWTTTHAWNTSSTFVVPSISTTLPPPVSTGLGQPETSAPAPAPEPTPTDAPGAGSHLVAGPVALIGGLAMAFLAL